MKRKVTFSRVLFSLGVIAAQIYALVLIFSHHTTAGVSLATLTFGDTAAPSDIAMYFDALFTQSLKNARGVLIDNIGASNAVFNKVIGGDQYESADGGTYIEEELMTALTVAESYDGMDELSTAETDGVTAVQYEWRQIAAPVVYSMKQVIQNKRRILDLVKTKMTQCRMGLQEGMSGAFMRGAGDAAIQTAKTNPINGSLNINPLGLLIKYDPTTTNVGNLNPANTTLWRNITKDSAATTGNGFIQEWMNVFNSCSLGTGGSPNLCLADQTTYELASMAIYQKYRQTSSDQSFPFTNIRIPFGDGKGLLVLDDKVPDAYSNLTSTATYGSLYHLNTQFFKLKYIEGRDFEMLTDENGKAFIKPANQDARVGHCAWMGQSVINNRRKLGVLAKIARTLTFS